jgi:hypothetical protein
MQHIMHASRAQQRLHLQRCCQQLDEAHLSASMACTTLSAIVPAEGSTVAGALS